MICPHCKKIIAKKEITAKTRNEVYKLYLQGASCRDIAEILGGISFSTVARIIRERNEE